MKDSIHKLLEEIKNSTRSKMNVMRNKPLCSMSDGELTDYIYNSLYDWPCKLSSDEMSALMHEMKASVVKMRKMGMTRDEVLDRNKVIREIREKKKKAIEEMNKPRLAQIEVML